MRPSDPWGPAIYAFDKVVANLGWAHDTDKIVFAHTHHPLDGVTKPGGGSAMETRRRISRPGAPQAGDEIIDLAEPFVVGSLGGLVPLITQPALGAHARDRLDGQRDLGAMRLVRVGAHPAVDRVRQPLRRLTGAGR